MPYRVVVYGRMISKPNTLLRLDVRPGGSRSDWYFSKDEAKKQGEYWTKWHKNFKVKKKLFSEFKYEIKTVEK